jgi:hypothetical protein
MRRATAIQIALRLIFTVSFVKFAVANRLTGLCCGCESAAQPPIRRASRLPDAVLLFCA